MTHDGFEDPATQSQLVELIADPEARPGLLRQIGNGVGGIIVLMLTGLVLMIAVLWKSP